MSEPIQAIAQNNYILHNIDAKKLYVQEPLFTANSGDAVYVGWRPDETVLWEGSGHSTVNNMNLSESWKNFTTIKIYGFCEGGSMYHEFNTNDMINSLRKEAVLSNGGFASWKQTNYFVNISIPCYFDNDNIISSTSAKYIGYWNNTWQAQTISPNIFNEVTKIIGIGRKQ